MDDLIKELVQQAQRCNKSAKTFDVAPLKSMTDRVFNVIKEINDAWSGSPIGYHSYVYTVNLQPKRPGECFDSAWGFYRAFGNQTTGDWREYTYDAIERYILTKAKANEDSLKQSCMQSCDLFNEIKAELLPKLDAILSLKNDNLIKELRDNVAKLEPQYLPRFFEQATFPPNASYGTHDPRAIQGGIQAPPHVQIQSRFLSYLSYGRQLKELAKSIRYVVNYLQEVKRLQGPKMINTKGPIFIGHGGKSHVWIELQRLLEKQIKVDTEEFNSVPTAGIPTQSRLMELLDKCPFAFLVMTAEDEQPDKTLRARENVIHEIGLFQGRYGFERAIILLEDGCQEFSNIHGLGQIRFPKGNVIAKSEEIRAVLKREGIIS